MLPVLATRVPASEALLPAAPDDAEPDAEPGVAPGSSMACGAPPAFAPPAPELEERGPGGLLMAVDPPADDASAGGEIDWICDWTGTLLPPVSSRWSN